MLQTSEQEQLIVILNFKDFVCFLRITTLILQVFISLDKPETDIPIFLFTLYSFLI